MTSYIFAFGAAGFLLLTYAPHPLTTPPRRARWIDAVGYAGALLLALLAIIGERPWS